MVNDIDPASEHEDHSRALQRLGAKAAMDMVHVGIASYDNIPVRLGVSRRWLVKAIVKYDLSQVDVNALVATRVKHQASLPMMLKLMSKENLTAEDVYQLYEDRSLVEQECSNEGGKISVSLKVLLRFSQVFSEAQLDEDSDNLSDLATEVFREVKKRFPWVKWPDLALNIVCDVAERGEFATLEAVMDDISVRHLPERFEREHGPAGGGPQCSRFEPVIRDRPDTESRSHVGKPRWRPQAIKRANT